MLVGVDGDGVGLVDGVCDVVSDLVKTSLH